MKRVEKIERPKRKFLPENFAVTDWPGLKPYFDNLLSRELNSVTAMRNWLQERSELESLFRKIWRGVTST
jgi:oligoendopeptidase F